LEIKMLELQTSMNNLPPIDNLISVANDDDDIRELGDRIANLTLAETKELNEYLTVVHRVIHDNN
jgi:hypothetical protein